LILRSQVKPKVTQPTLRSRYTSIRRPFSPHLILHSLAQGTVFDVSGKEAYAPGGSYAGKSLKQIPRR
jgi:hypothetical protein